MPINTGVRVPNIVRNGDATFISVPATTSDLSLLLANGLKCDGITDDTMAMSALLASISSTPTTLTFPAGKCLLSTISFPTNITLDFTQSGAISVVSGQTVTIQGGILEANRQIFYNSLAGQGTISLAGNKCVSVLHPEWWGAAKNGATNDLAALQATTEAADTVKVFNNQGATIDLGVGAYNIGAGTWKIANANAQHHINIIGVNLNATSINCNTSGGNAAMYLNLEKYVTLRGFSIVNGGAKGGDGIQLGGDGGTGTQTNGNRFEQLFITNFNHGILTTGGIGTSSEIEFDHCVLQGNTYGFFSANFNALNYLFTMVELYSNTTAGLSIQAGNMTVLGGASANNGNDFLIAGGNDCQVKIMAFRAETPINQWLVLQSNNYLSIEDCIIHMTTNGTEVINTSAELHVKNTWMNGFIRWHGSTLAAITLDHVRVNTLGTDWSLSNQLSSGPTPFGPGIRFTNDTTVNGSRIYVRDVLETSTGIMYPDIDGVVIANPTNTFHAVVGINKGQGGVLALTNGTANPYAYMHHLNDSGLLTTLSPVAGFSTWATELILIPDQAFTTNTSGNIGKVSTAIVGQPMIFTKDIAANKWYPSY